MPAPLPLPENALTGYRLVERLGSGGMGDVFKAFSESLERPVAVKILHDPQQADRFRNEALIQASIRHPHIAVLHEYRLLAGRPCLVMEYVEGPTLDRLAGRIGVGEVERILGEVASAVAHLHRKGVVHRDLKPANVKRTPDGTVKLLDFGIARHATAPRTTRQGYVVGTAEYLAPEQFRQEVSPASDVWSFGVLAYELLTGQLPFAGDSLTALRVRVEAGRYTPAKVFRPDATPRLLGVIEHCLRRDPAQRPPMTEVLDRLSGTRRQAWNLQPGDWLRARVPLLLTGAGIVAVWCLYALLAPPRPASGTGTRSDVTPRPASLTAGALTVEVSVVNAPGAAFIAPDGTSHALPYRYQGQPGDVLRGTLRAAGFRDKFIEVLLNDRRQRYDYVLETAF
jgi:serine/threonine protein kinase